MRFHLVGVLALTATLSGCVIATPPLKAQAGVGARLGQRGGAIARASAGAHLASVWANAPVDVGIGVVTETATGDENDSSGYYVEAAARVQSGNPGQLWVGGHWEQTLLDDRPADAFSVRLDWQAATSMCNGSGGGGGSSFIGGAVCGALGTGYFVEGGARWMDGAMHDSFVLVGTMVRLPFIFGAALFR